MLVLALDTALGATSACVLDTDTASVLAERSVVMARGHAEALLPLVDETMTAANVAFDALDRIAVTTGPGSFTGLRVGLAAARGIGIAAGKPVVGVTTLTAYSAALVSEGGRDPVICVIDARHDQVYYQVVSGNGSPLVRPRAAPIGQVLDAARFGYPQIVGDAAQIIADRWPSAMPPILIDARPAPPIAWVGWVGAAIDPDASPAKPMYLKPPDAKPQASAALARAPG